MKGLSYKLLTKSWEDPDGFMHEGKWREFTLADISTIEKELCIHTGFKHLLSDQWIWVHYPDRPRKRPYFIHIENIDKIVDMNDNVVELEYYGLNFKLKEK